MDRTADRRPTGSSRVQHSGWSIETESAGFESGAGLLSPLQAIRRPCLLAYSTRARGAERWCVGPGKDVLKTARLLPGA